MVIFHNSGCDWRSGRATCSSAQTALGRIAFVNCVKAQSAQKRRVGPRERCEQALRQTQADVVAHLRQPLQCGGAGIGNLPRIAGGREVAEAEAGDRGEARRARQVAEARTLASERWEVPMGSEPMISDAVAEQVRPRSGTQWAERAWELSQWGDDAEALDAVDAGLAVSFETLERVRLLQEGVQEAFVALGVVNERTEDSDVGDLTGQGVDDADGDDRPAGLYLGSSDVDASGHGPQATTIARVGQTSAEV